MEKSADVFIWTRKLECPPASCSDSAMKILRTGLVGLLFDNLGNTIFTTEETKTARKNILLYQLKHGTPNKVVQCIQNTSQLKLDEADLNDNISQLEEEYEQMDFAVRQKKQRLRNISAMRLKTKTQMDLLKMKHEQTVTQLRDCNDMRLVCQHLMPSTCKDFDPNVLQHMLTVVTSLWTGANKRQVLETLMNNLDHIEVPILWQHLYQNLKNDELMKPETIDPLDTNKKTMNIGIAKLHGQHISLVLKRVMNNAVANNYQKSILEYIQKIETASNNSADITEWLILALQIRKLESEQKYLLEEMDKVREDLHQNSTFTFDIPELISEIQDINIKISEYAQDIQQSLNLLKSMPMFITKIKEKIYAELQKIKALRNDNFNSTWLNNDLCTELDVFYKTLDVSALRKIKLSGDIGVHRYTKSCFSEASVSVTNFQASNITSYFPMIQTPIYSLIELYKNIILTSIYKKFEALKIEENPDTFQMPIITCKENYDDIIEVLNSSKAINIKTAAEIEEFNEILNAWIYQTVQKAMKIIDKSVDDATFPDWVERYSLMLHTLQNFT